LHEQLKLLFLLDNLLVRILEAVAEVAAKSSSSRRRFEPAESGPSHHEKGKAAARIVSFAREVDEK